MSHLRSPLATGLVLAACCLFLSPPAAAQGDRQADGLAREEMWRAPTEEDWARPVLVTFQRTWDDALAVSRETGRPILACVNMDGEIASEHYAGIRYRQADVAELYEPYVNVVASVYRHTPRDYDEQGQRIPCPRFGSVTCGEHIAIEPLLYERYFDEVRVAPRHVMIELDKAETYDVYYAFDTASVFETIRAGIADRDVETRESPWSDLPLADRVGSRDVGDREQLEQAFREGDDETRVRLLESAVRVASADGGHEHHDLYRMALFSGDPTMARLAWQGLAGAQGEGSIDVILEALRFEMPEADRAALVEGLERIGESSDRARTLARVHKAVGNGGPLGEVTWGAAGDRRDAVRRLEARAQYRSATAAGDPTMAVDDPTRDLELAASYVELAMHPGTETEYAPLFVEDARRTATDARARGADAARCNAVIALCASLAGDRKLGQEQAVASLGATLAAAEGMTLAGAVDWLDERSALELVVLFAEGRQLQIVKALRAKEDWDQTWMGDVDAAYAFAAGHAQVTDLVQANHYDFLRYMGAFGRSNEVLDAAIQRFPESGMLHERLRRKLIRERRLDALDGLEGTYEAMVAANPSSWLRWYAGYASRTAAEFHRRAGRRDQAMAAYDRALGHFEASVTPTEFKTPANFIVDADTWRTPAHKDPTFLDASAHQVAVCLAGQARVAMELDDLASATALLVQGIQHRPNSTMTLDGLNLSASDTVRTLRQRLTDAGLEAELAQLDACTSQLDPSLLAFPAFEAPARPPANRGNRGGNRGPRGTGPPQGGGQGGGR